MAKLFSNYTREKLKYIKEYEKNLSIYPQSGKFIENKRRMRKEILCGKLNFGLPLRRYITGLRMSHLALQNSLWKDVTMELRSMSSIMSNI